MRTKKSRGTALIEFAAALVLLTGMFTGIFQVSYTFLTYSKLMNAVRAGARYASLEAPSSHAADPEFTRDVTNIVIYGDPRPVAGAKPVVSGLTPGNVELILGPSAATVSVRDFEIDSIFTRMKLAGRPTVTFPFTGGVPK